MSTKATVLVANILIRAVLGQRVGELILQNANIVKFFAPAIAFSDARKYLPALLEKRGVRGATALAVLDTLATVVQIVDEELYVGMQAQALQRIAMRDAVDWPVLACAMSIDCPVWTEDADFLVPALRPGPPIAFSCISFETRVESPSHSD
jgi:predicted nucleic acid-binding protein